MTRRSGGGALFVLSVVVVGSAGLAAPGAAYMRPIAPMEGSTSAGSGVRKSLTRACPAGGRALGGGASINSGLFGGGLTAAGAMGDAQIRAAASATSQLVRPAPASWTLGIEAFCATPTPNAEGPVNALRGVELVSAESPASAAGAATKSAYARCPDNKFVIAGGAYMGGSGLGLTWLGRTRGARAAAVVPDVWQASAQEIRPVAGSWDVRAYALCAASGSAPANDYVGTPRVVIANSRATSLEQQTGQATCDPSETLVGGGARIVGTEPGSPGPTNVVLSSSFPAKDPAAWVAAGAAVGAPRERWHISLVAICARQGPRPLLRQIAGS